MAYKLIERLREEYPEEDPVMTAVRTLSGQNEVKAFYREYVRYLKENGRSEDVRINPEAVACQTLEAVISLYRGGPSEENVTGRWYSALPDLRNGRGREVLCARKGLGKREE